MFQVLQAYFLQHRHLFLPGIGKLNAEAHAARFDASQQMMLPPYYTFQWSPADAVTDSPQSLVGFISRQSGQTEEESFDALQAFCRNFRETITQNGEWEWPGLGKWVSLNEEQVGFVPDKVLESYFAPLPAVRVVQKGKIHAMTVGDKETTTSEMQQMLWDESAATAQEDRWWIPAAIIGTISLGLIIARLSGLL